MKFMEKVWDNLGLFESSPQEDDEDRPEKFEQERKKAKGKNFNAAGISGNFQNNAANNPPGNFANNVISLPTAGQTQNQQTLTNFSAKQLKVIVVEPCSFDDAQHVADYLKSKKAVVVNLENTEEDATRRMVDFISGTTYALNGTIQKVGNNIFLCAPPNVDITFNSREETKGKTLENLFFSWKGF